MHCKGHRSTYNFFILQPQISNSVWGKGNWKGSFSTMQHVLLANLKRFRHFQYGFSIPNTYIFYRDFLFGCFVYKTIILRSCFGNRSTLKADCKIFSVLLHFFHISPYIHIHHCDLIIFTAVCCCLSCFSIHFNLAVSFFPCPNYSARQTNLCNGCIIAVKTNHISRSDGSEYRLNHFPVVFRKISVLSIFRKINFTLVGGNTLCSLIYLKGFRCNRFLCLYIFCCNGHGSGCGYAHFSGSHTNSGNLLIRGVKLHPFPFYR